MQCTSEKKKEREQGEGVGRTKGQRAECHCVLRVESNLLNIDEKLKKKEFHCKALIF